MRKGLLKQIRKEVKKGNMNGVLFNPTLEECDYLYKYNITSTKSITNRKTLVGSYRYTVETTDFCLE